MVSGILWLLRSRLFTFEYTSLEYTAETRRSQRKAEKALNKPGKNLSAHPLRSLRLCYEKCLFMSLRVSCRDMNDCGE
jgi:hypothetical protein